jgi:hypothetical protein
MEPLNNLLKRLRLSLGRDAESKEIIVSSIKDAVGFEVRIKDISIAGDILRITTTPTKRSEINLNQSKILELIRSRSNLKLNKILY